MLHAGVTFLHQRIFRSWKMRATQVVMKAGDGLSLLDHERGVKVRLLPHSLDRTARLYNPFQDLRSVEMTHSQEKRSDK